MRNDRNVMVNFKPDEYVRKMFIQTVIQAERKNTMKNPALFLKGVEPLSWLPVQMLYHSAAGDPWELSPLNQVTNILHTATNGVSICFYSQ